jgi:5,10-methylenetetrahydromethanopterin reductase
MRFAVGMGRNLRIDEVAEHSRLAEKTGFDYLTFVDIPLLNRDVYVMMGIAALNTKHILIGHGVTDPYTWHPSVIANATATINEMSGGRTFVGIGVGGLWGKVMNPQPLNDFRQAVNFIREYSSGNPAEWKGATMHSEWIKNQMKIYMACGGPKSLQLGGEIADGVILTSNADPVTMKWRIEQIEKGAEKAGRDPNDIDVWARGMIYVTDQGDYQQARRQVSGYAVNGAIEVIRLLNRKSPEVEELRRRMEKAEPGLIDQCQKVYNAFDPKWLEHVDAPAANLITDDILAAQQFLGKPDVICEHIDKLKQIGIKTIGTVTYTIADKKGMMEEISKKIMPYFRN